MEEIDVNDQLEAVPRNNYVMRAKCGLPKATAKKDEMITNTQGTTRRFNEKGCDDKYILRVDRSSQLL